MVVLKYLIDFGKPYIIKLPVGARPLSGIAQEGKMYLYAQVDEEPYDIVERAFALFGTGHSGIKPNYKYIDTIIQGVFVWHLYEVPMDQVQVVE